MTTETSPGTLKAVETMCAVLAAIRDLKGAGVTEVADHLGISKGGAYNHLSTLH